MSWAAWAAAAGSNRRVALPRPGNALGQLIVSQAEQYGLTIDDFMAALGVSRSAVYNWITRKSPEMPSIAHRDGLAEVLGVDRHLIDEHILMAKGHQFTRLRPQVERAAYLMARLDEHDVDDLIADILRRLALRNAEKRKLKGRRAGEK